MIASGEDLKARSRACQVFTGEESIVQQHFRDEVDINNIVRKFGISRDEVSARMANAMYGDFTGVTGFAEAREFVRGLEERFSYLPPHLRDRFENDPAKLVAWADQATEEDWRRAMTPPEAPAVAPTGPVAPVQPAGAPAAAVPPVAAV